MEMGLFFAYGDGVILFDQSLRTDRDINNSHIFLLFKRHCFPDVQDFLRGYVDYKRKRYDAHFRAKAIRCESFRDHKWAVLGSM